MNSKSTYFILLTALMLLAVACTNTTKTLVIGTQNVWGLEAEEVIDHFEKMEVDLLCTQEARHIDEEKIKAYGLHIHKFSNNNKGPVAIISRLPFIGTTPNDYGVYLDLGDGITALVMDCHGAHKPYGPYQAAGISYGKGDGVEDPDSIYVMNKEARQEMVDLILEDFRSATTDFVTLCGDFNEPSWLDWTDETTKAGMTPFALPWATSYSLWEGGINGDAYRTIHPDPVVSPGITWSPKPADIDTKDRIDLILYKKGKGTKVKECKIFGESAETSDIVLEPWIFDHRGVRAIFEYSR